ncbi:helix-turn-helix domain-containing protein [Kineothrix sp. MB12-C1]|uniref:helix-turn-helix domain-containing protein n=1 Tax=Kineothrix sp. MB12-C1 TaxID=3070215 RepID=UPI0027D219D5|nr:helix-turn-helix domain-containing protein [Kineothrix sp. MB12-C1]WMC92082.1 helix-turn-helix domain-containing protein [Kineothrix sp. MB12-C1]
MDQEITKIVMNPIRLRIIQYLLLHGVGTSSQIKEELSDIPPASLYRHIKMLYEANCIMVVEEKKIRGTVERTYALRGNKPCAFSKVSVEQLINSSLMSLMTSFGKYFSREDADPMKDLLSLSTSTLLLTDEEFTEVMEKIGEAITPYLGNQEKEGRNIRKLTFISSPGEEEEKE